MSRQATLRAHNWVTADEFALRLPRQSAADLGEKSRKNGGAISRLFEPNYEAFCNGGREGFMQRFLKPFPGAAYRLGTPAMLPFGTHAMERAAARRAREPPRPKPPKAVPFVTEMRLNAWTSQHL
jgi:hypothetical protein